MYSSHPPHTPRSILKQQHSPVSVGCRSPDRPPAVHFPPSPALTRVYAAHPSSAYDRSPIVVSPNTCALPERGCPARSAPSNRRPSNGNHFHPRAVSNSISTSPTRSIGDDHTRSPPRTSPFTPPPLIPDLSSDHAFVPDAMMPTSPYCPAQPSFPDDYPSPYLPHRSSPDDSAMALTSHSLLQSSYTLREMDDGCLGGF
ncbi:hypothetical protein BKA83DRAFT_4270582 [Pisolithus microcarpus]|nr:hypothetical protein BKA83DRAFT_4270582 [Pisolithus microcarpus]